MVTNYYYFYEKKKKKIRNKNYEYVTTTAKATLKQQTLNIHTVLQLLSYWQFEKIKVFPPLKTVYMHFVDG